MKVFVLGSPDPEMEEIERVLREQGEVVCYAKLRNSRVRADTAYQADGISLEELPENPEFIFVECAVLGLRYADLVDHHRPGDPGYDMPAARYFEGSSLGQVLTMLGLESTALQRVMAAADHCPTQAYRGLCPGVDVELLRQWRTESRAARRGVSPEEMEQAIARCTQVLQQCERIDFAGSQLAWIGNEMGEFAEASARYGIPFMYCEKQPDGRHKFGIMGAEPEVIERWMRECQLSNVYGNPARGYAGGYAA